MVGLAPVPDICAIRMSFNTVPDGALTRREVPVVGPAVTEVWKLIAARAVPGNRIAASKATRMSTATAKALARAARRASRPVALVRPLWGLGRAFAGS